MEKYDDVQQFMRQQQSSGGIFAGTTVNGLRYNLTTDRRIYRRGDQMRISFTTCNTTARTITLNYNSSQRFDITVLDGGRTVWRWSDGRLFNRTPGIERLGPGECRLYRAVWDLRDRRGNFVGQGSYTIRAENMAVQLSNRFVQTRVTVSGGSQVITPPRPPISPPRPPRPPVTPPRPPVTPPRPPRPPVTPPRPPRPPRPPATPPATPRPSGNRPR